MWTSVDDLFTPTSLFLFLNLTIAAIAITSRKNKHPPPFPDSDHHYHHHHHNEHLLPRAPSLLERVRSLNFNFSSDSETESTTPTHHFDGGSRHHFFNHHDVVDGGGSSLPTTPTARALERASSLIKSLHFSPLRRPNPETASEPRAGDHHHQPSHFFGNDVVDGSTPPTTPTARALERASSLFKSLNNFSPLRRPDSPVSEPRAGDHHHHNRHFLAKDDVVSGSSTPPTTPTARALERASSLFKSHRFSPLLRSSGPDPEPVKPETNSGPRPGDHDDHHLVKRSKSESEGGKGRKTKMTKSASEKCAAEVVAAAAVVEVKEEEERRRPATVRLQKAVSIGDDHGVDSKADDFINRFKQQLKLQRLDSLLRNRELLRVRAQQQELQHEK